MAPMVSSCPSHMPTTQDKRMVQEGITAACKGCRPFVKADTIQACILCCTGTSGCTAWCQAGAPLTIDEQYSKLQYIFDKA